MTDICGLLDDDLIHHCSATRALVETAGGSSRTDGPPVRVGAARPSLRWVPGTGEHDAAVRAEFGRDSQKIRQRAAGGAAS